MKTLYIMRHAKSDWSVGESDINRPLNQRGEHAAPLMGKFLYTQNIKFDLMISSPAKRAFKTAKHVANETNYPYENIKIEDSFYFGGEEAVINFIKKTDKRINNLIIVGHNPTSEEIIQILASENFDKKVPTASIAAMNFNVETWKEIELKKGKLLWFICPKSLNFK